MSIALLRAELTEVIDSVVGLSCPEYMKDSPKAGEVLLDYELDAPIAFAHGGYQYTFHAGIIYNRQSPKSAQIEADRHKDFSDETGLARVLCDHEWEHCAYVWPRSATGLQQVTFGSTDYLLVDFTLEVVL